MYDEDARGLLYGDLMQALQNLRLLDVVEGLHHFGAELVDLRVLIRRYRAREHPPLIVERPLSESLIELVRVDSRRSLAADCGVHTIILRPRRRCELNS